MAVITANGRNIEIQNLTLSSSSDIQVGFVNPCNTVIIKARTAVDIQIRDSRSAPNFYTLASGNTLTLNLVGKDTNTSSVADPFNIWIRSVSATPVVEVIGIYGG